MQIGDTRARSGSLLPTRGMTVVMFKCVSFQAVFPSWASSEEYTFEAAKPSPYRASPGQLLSKVCHNFFSLSFGLENVYSWVLLKPKSLCSSVLLEKAWL